MSKVLRLLISLVLLGFLGSALAQTPAKVTTPTPKETQPAWRALSTPQQQALAPLEAQWHTLPAVQKRKWIKLAENYQKLSAPEQAKLQERMRDWVKLTPEQRAQARLNFGTSKELSAEEKQQRWREYQALSPEERQTLRKEARRETPKSAAIAITPQTKLVLD